MLGWTRAIVLAAAALCCSAALPSITSKGPYLFNSQTGDRFFIKGVAYPSNYGSGQTLPAGSISADDPLGNPAGCQRDVPYIQQLGANVVRVYQVNASVDHSECMAALDSAGIYVILDLALPGGLSINSVSPSWTTDLLNSYIDTIDAMGNYTNVIGFNVGNEVINGADTNGAAPYIKAAARDVKAYLKSHNYPQLVGYAGTDTPTSRVALPYYLACEDTSSSIDYWSINIYEWCGQSDFVTSGYQQRTIELASLGIPAFFSEDGCNAVEPRTFQDLTTLYSSNMTGVWSGAIIYEFIEQGNAYGLVNISADGSSLATLPDYNNLKAQYTGITPAGNVSISSYTPSISEPVSCPQVNSSWAVSNNIPPTPNAGLCSCVVNEVACVATYVSTDTTDIGTALGTVCGESSAACSSISGNGTTGTYGALSMCGAEQLLDIALGSYYAQQGFSAQACNFGGAASVEASGKPTDSSAFASATSSCVSASGFASGTGIPSPTSVPAGVSTNPLVSTTSTSSSTSKSGAVSVYGGSFATFLGVGLSVLAGVCGAAVVLL